jgi:hypothetical protein
VRAAAQRQREPAGVRPPHPPLHVAAGDVDRDPSRLEARHACAVHLVGGVDHRRHDAGHAGVDQGVRARRRAAMVAARLQADVDGRAGGVARGAKRSRLGMHPARSLVPALAEHAPVPHDDRSDDRVGRGRAAAALGQLETAVEVSQVVAG